MALEQKQQAQRAIHVEAFNLSDPAAACKVVESTLPKPGSGQLLLKMLCRPVNPSDILCIQGLYSGGPRCFPFVPGLEGMGEIAEVGDGVTGLRMGQRVFHVFVAAGSWQEYALVSATEVIPVPDGIPNEIAAQFFVNPWTAYGMLEVLKVPAGEYVLQTAAGSVLGRMFIQLVSHRGVKTINLVRRDDHKEELKAIGADEVINFTTEDVVEQVSKITGGRMAYGAIDAVGGAVTKVVCSSVRAKGKVICYGVLGGDMDSRVDVRDLINRQVKLCGFHLSKWVESFANPDDYQKTAAKIFELIGKGVMVPLVGEKFPLEQSQEAIRKSVSNARGGKVLLIS